MRNEGNYLWLLEQKLKTATITEDLYKQRILKDKYDDIISSSSVVHFYFKERGIMKYSQEEVFGLTELIGKANLQYS